MTKQIASTEPQVGSHNHQEELNKQEQVRSTDSKTRGIEMVKGAASYRSYRFQERRL